MLMISIFISLSPSFLPLTFVVRRVWTENYVLSCSGRPRDFFLFFGKILERTHTFSHVNDCRSCCWTKKFSINFPCRVLTLALLICRRLGGKKKTIQKVKSEVFLCESVRDKVRIREVELMGLRALFEYFEYFIRFSQLQTQSIKRYLAGIISFRKKYKLVLSRPNVWCLRHIDNQQQEKERREENNVDWQTLSVERLWRLMMMT